MIRGNPLFQGDVAKHRSLLFVWSAHVHLDAQPSFLFLKRGIFPQPVKPCRKVGIVSAASAAGLLEFEMSQLLFSMLVFA
jgi:hypothetical protein